MTFSTAPVHNANLPTPSFTVLTVNINLGHEGNGKIVDVGFIPERNQSNTHQANSAGLEEPRETAGRVPRGPEYHLCHRAIRGD